MRRPLTLGARFLLAVSAVVLIVVAGIFLVDSIVGPAIFHSHLAAARLPDTPAVLHHIEEGFQFANTIALAVAIVAAIAVAAIASSSASSRIDAAVSSFVRAATRVSRGDYSARIRPPSRLGAEFGALGAAFDSMAARLEHTEAIRHRQFSDLAHELRTPIAIIEAQVEGMEDGIAGVDASLPVLAAQAKRLGRLADDLGLLSRVEEGALRYDFAVTDVAAVVADCADALRLRFQERGVRLETRLQPASARCDRHRLGQVVTNLLANALHATPAGGAVAVSAATIGDVVRIVVHDTGAGIAADQLPHLFERFYRAERARDRDRGGFGIGLAIARGIITDQGGTITAASAGRGRGAQFTVELPRSAG
ncbi:MAG: ATP-binding protein [Pseudoclavibacter sp.]